MFDWGVLCSTESGVIVDEPVKKAVIEEFKKRGAYFVSPEERERLSKTMFDPRGAINPDIVGKSPSFIAGKAGFDVPGETSCLVAEISEIGRQQPLSREKLSPVVSMITVNGWQEGCERCIEMLQFGGIGHSMVIHSSDSEVILKFGLEKPAFRILVNTQAALGAVGYTNELTPSMTLGPGTFGGSIVSENVSARHLINIKKLAFETRPIHSPEDFGGRPERFEPGKKQKRNVSPEPLQQPVPSWIEIIEERIRASAGNRPSHTPAAHTPVPQKSPAAQTESPKQPTLGTGISEAEVERIIKEFKK